MNINGSGLNSYASSMSSFNKMAQIDKGVKTNSQETTNNKETTNKSSGVELTISPEAREALANGSKMFEIKPNANFPCISEQNSSFLFKSSQGYSDNSEKIKDGIIPDTSHRYVLNVDQHPELYKKLEEFAIKYNCAYKSHILLEKAEKRPDTVVIYTADTRYKEQR